ncbi:MAG: hypothetical protein AAB433_21500, partial [Nitrospirota bacterium]
TPRTQTDCPKEALTRLQMEKRLAPYLPPPEPTAPDISGSPKSPPGVTTSSAGSKKDRDPTKTNS